MSRAAASLRSYSRDLPIDQDFTRGDTRRVAQQEPFLDPGLLRSAVDLARDAVMSHPSATHERQHQAREHAGVTLGIPLVAVAEPV